MFPKVQNVHKRVVLCRYCLKTVFIKLPTEEDVIGCVFVNYLVSFDHGHNQVRWNGLFSILPRAEKCQCFPNEISEL